MLTHLFNLSITKGIVPKELKIGKVYKNENCMLVNNFRPVSVLPLFSKILERLMYSWILSFFNKHNLFYKYQFGFRERHGTAIALIVLIDKIMSALNEGDYVLGVFLDLSKAFDTVDHNILLMKLYKYGSKGVAYDWIKSYLEERKQYVSFNKHDSSTMDIKCGVPQGSILGPLLFLIYVNDLSNVSSILFILLFADDTNVFVTGKNLSTLFTTMNSELVRLSEWMNVNKLSLNVKKTKYMVFCTKKPSVILNDIVLNCEIKEKVEHFKFLGVHIDSKLKWSYHIQFIRKKMSKGIGILYRAKDYLKYDTLLTLYYSFIYPYIVYCIEVKGNLVSLLKLQKRVLRIIKSVPTKTDSAPLFRELGILSVFKVYMIKLAVVTFKSYYGFSIESIKELFTDVQSVHDRDTRQSRKYYVPFTRKEIVRKSFKYRAAKLWNNLFDILEINCSVACFKHYVKSYLTNNGGLDMLDSCLLWIYGCVQWGQSISGWMTWMTDSFLL